MTLDSPASPALTLGTLSNFRATAAFTGALVTNCNSVSTSVGVTGCGLPLVVIPAYWTRSCAEAEYTLGWDSEYPSEATKPSTVTTITHHFRRRQTAR